MLQGILKVTDDKNLDRLHEGVLKVLQKTGIKLHNDYLLKELADRGCAVDFEEGVVKFSPDTVETQIKAQSGRYKMVRSSLWDPFCGEEPADSVSFPDEFICDFGHAAISIYDYPAGAVRKPGVPDQVEMIKLGNALDAVRGVCAPFTLSEFDGRIETLESARILMNHTPKPGWVGTYSAKQLRYLKQLAEIAVDGNTDILTTVPPIVVTVMCTTSPLRLDNRSCDVLEEALKHEFPINFSTMPIMGATTPVTPAGSAVVGAAEILGGIVAASLINPNVYYYTASITSEMDFRTTQLRFSTPSAVLTDALLNQLFRYKYGIVHNIEPAYVDAKYPGSQAAYLKMFRQMALAACSAMPLPLGLLDNGSTFSPAQAMIDLDMNEALYHFSRGVEIGESEMALDAISEIGFGDSATYLEHEHTFGNFRDCQWDTKVFERNFSLIEDAPLRECEERILDRAEERWRELLKNAPEFELPEHKKSEIDRIVEAGKKDILGPG